MKVGALENAKTSLTNLADDIEAARTRALAATPPNVYLSSLSISGVCGSLPTWLREQAADPIGVVLDLARLLDENGNGQATYTSSSGESLDDLRTELGRLIADGLSKVDDNDRDRMQSYTDLMDRYGDDAAVMASVMGTLGRNGTQAVLNRADDLDVDIAPSFGDEGQKIIAGWVADDVHDPDEIDNQTNVFLKNFRDQAAFATELYSDVTPDEMGDAIKYLSNNSFPADGMSMPDVELAKVYDQFLNYAGHTLATYSQNVSDPAALADDWYGAISGGGTDDLMGHENPENAAALTMLIKRGGQQAEFDDVFLGDLTNLVYDWEQSFDGDAVWGPLNDQLGEGYGIKDPDMDYGDTTTADDNQAFGVGAYDGLANLLGGMEKSPEAAERFFTRESDGTYVDQVDYNGEKVNAKLLYLFNDRIWPTDDGDGFGIALQHAATHSRDDGGGSGLTEGDRAARLASQSIFIVGHETGRDDNFYDDRWRIPEGMRDNMGYMLAAYAPDIQRISAGTGEGEDGGFIWGDADGESPYHGIVGLSASQEDLATMLQGIGRGDDKEGITAVLTSQVAHHENLMADALSDYNEAHPYSPRTMEQLMTDPGFRGDLFTNSESNGSALAFVLENGVEGGQDDEDARAARAEMMAKAFSIGTSFIPGAGDVLGEGASELAKGTFDVVKGEALGNLESAIGAAPDGLSQRWGNDGEGQIREGLSFGTFNALLNAGFLDSDVDPDYGIPHGAVTAPNEHGYIQVDPRLYDGIEDDLPPELRNEFQSWVSGTNPSSQPPSEALSAALSGYSTKVSSWIAS